MNWFNKLTSATTEAFEIAARARALSTLRRMDAEFLRQFGYAPEKVAQGMSAWPWLTETGAEIAAIAIVQPVLKSANDDQATEIVADLPQAA